MKNLRSYINENYLDESAWDIEDNIDDDNKEFVIDEIKNFIEDNYINFNIKNCEFIFDKKKGKYIVNCNQQVVLKSSVATQLTNELFEWGVIGGDFSCAYCPKLKSLQGTPEIVEGGFNCVGCNKLSSLKGAPKEVGRNFNCVGCSSLHSLDGIGKVKGRICSDIR